MRQILFALVLGLAAPPAIGQEVAGEREYYIISDVFAAAGCTPETARPISFDEAVSAPIDDTAPDCVSVDGIWAVRDFYAGLDEYYTGQLRDSFKPSRVRLGVYGWREKIAPPERPIPFRLTGRIGDCAQLGGPDVMMVMGYCHYGPGRYIALGHALPTGPAIERLTGAVHRARLGNLLEADLASSLHAAAEARARDWLALLRAGDVEAYARAYRMEYQAGRIDEPDSDFHALFRDEDSIFRRLRNQEQADLRIWRFADPPADPDDQPRDPSDYSALACFRVGSWAEDRWPVAGVDADNNDDRPYACISLWRETFNGELMEYLAADVSGPGLAEPAQWRD